jgi:hypothetical protein
MEVKLHDLAWTVAAECRDKGAVVISCGLEGIRLGVENLTPEELRAALCTAIRDSFEIEEELRKQKAY